ncbi:MAG: hypothetical protein WC749_08865 [Dehalococcoidia bacterium]
MKKNPQRRTALIWLAITLISIIAIFAPYSFGMDGPDGGFAISFAAIVFAIIGVVVTIMYFRRAGALDNMVKGENLLAHWIYTPDEWQKYIEEEFAEDRAAKTRLFTMVAVISVVIGVGFYLFHRDDLMFTLVIFGGLIVLIGFVAFLSIMLHRFQNRPGASEVYISRDGVYLSRQFHTWQGMGACLEDVRYKEENTFRPRLEFEYSTPGKDMRYYETVRVPVPFGKEEEARKILEEIKATH